MPSVADRLLATSAAALETIHGEVVSVLSGSEAGKSFTCIIETESDLNMDSELGQDNRGKRIARFRTPPDHQNKPFVLQTDDGRRWKATRQPGQAFLTTDFELVEMTAHDS